MDDRMRMLAALGAALAAVSSPAHSGGVPVKELCRKHGFSDAISYLWRSKFGCMDVSERVHFFLPRRIGQFWHSIGPAVALETQFRRLGIGAGCANPDQ